MYKWLFRRENEVCSISSFFSAKAKRILTVLSAFLIALPASGCCAISKIDVLSLTGPFHGVEEQALDISPDRSGNFYLLTRECLYFYDARSHALEKLADNDCGLQQIASNHTMIVACSESQDVYRLENNQWAYLTHIPDTVEEMGKHNGYIDRPGKITLSEEELFYFYGDEDANVFLCSYQLSEGTYTYVDIPFLKPWCTYDWQQNALVGIIHEGEKDYMAQYDLGTKTLSKLFPVEYSGYVLCYDVYHHRAISGDRAGIVLTLENEQKYLLQEIPGTSALYVIDQQTLAGIRYIQTERQEVSLYHYDLESAQAFSYD